MFRAAWRRVFACLAILSTVGGLAFGSTYDSMVKKGRDHFGLYQWAQARKSFEQAISLDPTNPDAYYHLGLTLRKLNDITGAINAFEQALKYKTDEIDCPKALASMYIQLAKDAKARNDHAAMIDNLRKSIVAFPSNTSVAASLFEFLAADGDWKELARLGELVRNGNREALDSGDDKDLQKALVLTAKAYISLAEHSKARDFLRLAELIRNPNEEIARLRAQIGQTSQAVANNFFSEGKTLFEQGKFKQALEVLKKAQGAEPGNSEISNLIDLTEKRITVADFTQLARDAEKAGKYQIALEKIERALQFDEDNESLRTWYASITAHLDKIDKARQAAKARELNRKQAELEAEKKNAALLGAATEAERKRSFDAALINYEKLYAIDPKPALAAKIEELKKTIAAVKEKQKKLGNDLANATTLFSQEKFDEAYTVLKEVAEDPDAPAEELVVKLVQCCFRLDRLEEAQKYTLKLESISSSSRYLPYFNGSLAYRRGDYYTALDLLAPVYSQNPTIGTDLGQMVWMSRLFKYKWFFIVFGLMIGYSLLGPIRSWLADLKAAGLQHRINSAIAGANWAAAIPLLQKRLEADLPLSERKTIMVQLADCCLKAGQPHEAKAQALDVLAKDSKHAQATRILGEALFQLRDNAPESIDRIMAAFRLDENRKDLLAFLVEHFKSQQADSKTATDILLKHTTVAPEDRDTLIYLAKMFFKRSEYTAGSLKVFEKAMKVAPDAPEYLHGLVQCLTAIGRTEDAAKWRDVGRQKWPDSSYFSTMTDQSFSAGAAIPGAAKIGLKRDTPATPSQPEARSTSKPGADVVCKSCGAGNPAREYYCTSCGKPLK